MCPACVASAALMAGGVITTGGFTALVGKMLHTRKNAQTNDVRNAAERRNNHGNRDKQDGTLESRD